MSQDIFKYTGLVNVKYFIHGKEVSFNGHNEGLNAMFKYLCKALSGETNLSGDKPAFFDLRCKYIANNTEEWKSCLYNTLSLSGSEFYFDSTLASWVARFNIVLSYNMLDFDIIKLHLADGDFYLYLMSQSNNDFARLKLDTNKLNLTDIIPGTQALVEWTMLIRNN